MVRNLILGGVLCVLSGMAFAECSSVVASPGSFNINANGSASQSTIGASFSGVSCSAKTTINYPDFSDLVIGFYGGEEKFKLKFAWASGNPGSLASGNNSFNLRYTVSATRDNETAKEKLSYIVDGNTVEIKNVMLASAAPTGSFWLAAWQFLGCVINPWRYGTCRDEFWQNLSSIGGVFSANLIITFNRIPTTCKPDNLTLDLPPITSARARIPGIINDTSKEGYIILRCNPGETNARANRTAILYLRSSRLLATNPSVLLPNEDNGVGFILENKSGATIVLAQDGERFGENITRLGTIAKDAETSRSLLSTYNATVRAKYYVYDPDRVRSGKITSTATIVVEHQ